MGTGNPSLGRRIWTSLPRGDYESYLGLDPYGRSSTGMDRMSGWEAATFHATSQGQQKSTATVKSRKLTSDVWCCPLGQGMGT